MPSQPFLDQSHGEMPATIAGHFLIQKKLGEGGMSIVWAARHQLLGNQVAIKVLHPHLAHNKITRERFKQEAQAASQIEHPNVVRIIDFGLLEDERPYIIMDLIDGPSLSEEIKSRQWLPQAETIALFKELLDALQWAHSKGIVHRDLKPSNVMLARIGDTYRPKIVDFGIAKLLPQNQQDAGAVVLTQTGEVFGSPLYMSPEQCRGEKTDARSDIYAIGCMIYECLTGKPPIEGENMLEILYRHMKEAPRPIRDANPEAEISPFMEALIFRCLAKDPQDRPQTALQVRQALDEIDAAHNRGGLARVRAGLDIFKSRRQRLSTPEKYTLIACTLAILGIILTGFVTGFLYMLGQESLPEATGKPDWRLAIPDATIKNAQLTAESATGAVLTKAMRLKERGAHKDKSKGQSERLDLSTELEGDDPNTNLQYLIRGGDLAFKAQLFGRAAEIYRICHEISSRENGEGAYPTVECEVDALFSEYFAGNYQWVSTRSSSLSRIETAYADNRAIRLYPCLKAAIGDSLYRMHATEDSRQMLYQSIQDFEDCDERKISQDEQGKRFAALAYSRYADIMHQSKMKEEALKNYQKALPHWLSIADKPTAAYNASLADNKIAMVDIDLGQIDQAIKSNRSARARLGPYQQIGVIKDLGQSEGQDFIAALQANNQWLAAIKQSIENGINKMRN